MTAISDVSPSIPFLKFPEKVHEKLLGLLQPIDIFELSLCSRETKKAIEKSLISHQYFLEIRFRADFQSISVVRRFEFSEKRTNWVFNTSAQESSSQDPKPSHNRIVDGIPIDFFEKSDKNFKSRSPLPIDSVLKVFEYFISIFHEAKKEIRIMDLDLTLPKEPEFLEKFQKFSCFWRCQWLVVGEGRVSEEVMKGFLDFYEADVWKSLGCDAGPDFVYDRPITSTIFNAAPGFWINRQNLLTLDCEALTISSSNLTSEDFNAFLLKWTNGSDTKLQYLDVRGSSSISSEGFKKLDLDVILKDLPGILLPGCRKRTECARYQCFAFRIPYEKGVDLRRADGVLATVLVYQNRKRTCSFLFEVWKEQNPNLELELDSDLSSSLKINND